MKIADTDHKMEGKSRKEYSEINFVSETYKNTKKIWDSFSKSELICPDISEDNDIEI